MRFPRPVLIVGASGDIGRGIALRLICDGRPVALTHSAKGKPTVGLDPGNSPGYMVRWYGHDTRSAQQTNELVTSIMQDFGAAPDLVYCAGIAKDRALSLMSDDDWHDVLTTNLTGAFFAARALARHLMVAGDGRMVFIGSVAASKGTAGQANYAAAKGGLESMCREMAVELGRNGVTCNVVSPGLIEGRMINMIPEQVLKRVVTSAPLRQVGKASDVAGMVSFLVSDQGRYVTGQTIQVDGGLTAM